MADVAGAVTVTATNLDGQTDVQQAEVTMSTSFQWLFAFGTRNLRIAHIDAAGNVRILGTECTLTCVARTEAGLSKFALLALLDRPFGVSVQSLTIGPEVVAPGEAVNVTVGVVNGGFDSGTASLILSIKEPGATSFDPIAVGEVTLAGGEQGTVSFLFTPEVEGRYEVDVEGVKGAFDVVRGTEPALLRFSDLVITPEVVALGDPVTLSMFVENLGDEDSTVEIEFRINDVLFELRSVLVPGRISVEVIFEFTPPAERTYLVEFIDPDELIAPLTGEIIARTPSLPAEFVLSQLVITPLEVGPGGEVTIAFQLRNIGEEPGNYTARLLINGVEVATQDVIVEELSTVPVAFTINAPEEPGVYTVDVEGLTGMFRVVEGPTGVAVVRGTVTLEGRADHSGARVTFAGQEPVFTGADGGFQVDVEPGIYSVTVEKDGFLAATKADLEVSEDLTLRIRLLGGDADANGIVDVRNLMIAGKNQGKAESPWL